MQIILSEAEFQRLSAPARAEILSLMTGVEPAAPEAEEPGDPIADISIPEARQLVLGLSEKNLRVLSLFAKNVEVEYEELIGESGVYPSQVDFKRSFVGAVNRRARTVLKDRSTRLLEVFSDVSSGPGAYAWLSEKTAFALRVALDVPEPFPGLCLDRSDGADLEQVLSGEDGLFIPPESKRTMQMRVRLTEIMAKFGRHGEQLEERLSLLATLVARGFSVFRHGAPSYGYSFDEMSTHVGHATNALPTINRWWAETPTLAAFGLIDTEAPDEALAVITKDNIFDIMGA